MNVCVYGSVNNDIDKIYIESGELLGKMLAKKNYGLVFGGMKKGILGAVARGVFTNSKNVPIIGIVPEFFKETTKRDDIFENCTELVFTKNVSERKNEMKKRAKAIIVAPGGVGTFDEFFDAVCSKRWGFCDKPIVIYNINNYYEKLIQMLEFSIEEKFGKENYRETYKVFSEISEIIDYIENYK